MPSKIIKGCYFGLRNLNYIAVSRKAKIFLQENVIFQVPGCGHGEYICYLELAT
jgi:hypothetical protein